MENLNEKSLIEEFRQYLIDVYGYKENEIKIEYKINYNISNIIIYDIVIFKENKPYIVFEIRKDIESLNKSREISVVELYNKDVNFYVLVAPYGNEWYMECYKNDKLVENIPFFKNLDEKLIIKKLYDLFYKGGKENLLTVRNNLFYVLSHYKFLKSKFRNELIKIKSESFEIKKVEIFIALRLLSFIKVKNNKKLLEVLFDLTIDKSEFLKFKEEILSFLNNLIQSHDYEIIGFQPDLVKLNFNECYIKDNNEYANLVKNILESCNKNKSFSKLFYINISNIFIDRVDFTKYQSGVLIVGYNFFNAIKKHPKFREITKKINMIINFYDAIFENSGVNVSVVFLGKESENIYIANLDFEKLFKYEEKIINFLIQDQDIEENDNIFSITNEDFEKEKFEFIKILNILKKIKEKPHKRLNDLADIIHGSFCREKGDIQKLITLKSIKYNKIFSLEGISEECYKKHKNKLTKKNDFVIAKIGSYKFAEITKKYENCIVDNNLLIIRPKNQESYEIIKKFLFSELARYIFNNFRSGFTVQGKIFIQDLKEILVPMNLNDFDKIKLNYKERLKEEYFTPCEKEINFIGIKDIVLNFEVITGFLIKDDIERIKIKKADFQRDIYKNHLEKLKKFLQTQNTKYKFLPFLIFGIENFDKIDHEDFFVDNINLCRLCMSEDDFRRHVKIIDGNHRWNAIKESIDKLDDDFQIGVVFIILEKNAFSPIFYTLNSKSKPLISSDFINLMEQEDEVLNELRELGINSPSIYLDVRDFLKKKNIFNYSENSRAIDEKILELVDFIEKNDLEKNIFKIAFYVLNKSYFNKINDIHKLLIFFNIVKSILLFFDTLDLKNSNFNLSNCKKFFKFIKKEFWDFYQYLEETKLLEKIDKLDLYPIFETYKKTYIPKSRKIYISMPYHTFQDTVYYVVDSVVKRLSIELKIEIKLIRTDKHIKGVHNQIENNIFKEIEESDLLIADITGNNPNVFHEIGFKMGLDRSKGLKNPNIIFIRDTRGYYEEEIKHHKKINYEKDRLEISAVVRKNEVSTVKFNLSHIQQIEFYDSKFLEDRLYEILYKYFNYYQIKKV